MDHTTRTRTVMLVHRETLVRQALGHALGTDGTVEVVAVSERLDEDLVQRSSPDVVVIDAACIDPVSTDVIWRVKRRGKDAAILLLGDDVTRSQITDAFAAGADGVVLQTMSLAGLVDTIHRIRRQPPARLTPRRAAATRR